jgi:hypothetical protein
MRYKIMWE